MGACDQELHACMPVLYIVHDDQLAQLKILDQLGLPNGTRLFDSLEEKKEIFQFQNMSIQFQHITTIPYQTMIHSQQ